MSTQNKTSGPLVRRRQLPYESLARILNAIDFYDSHLDRLHRQCVAFGAVEPVYRNIAIERHNISVARHELCELFEKQYEPNASDVPTPARKL